MPHRALPDAVVWDDLANNPAEHASLPHQRRGNGNRPQPWTVDELVDLVVGGTDRNPRCFPMKTR